MKSIFDKAYYFGLLIVFLISFFPIFYNMNRYTNSFVIYTFAIIFIIKFTIQEKKFQINTFRLRVYYFLIFWTIYSLFTIVWAKSIKLTLIHTHYVSLFLITFIIFTQSFRSKKFLNIFYYSLIGIFFLYQVIAIWELTTLQHLATSRAGSDGIFSFVPYGPFYNRNDMAAVLLMLSPFVLFRIHISKNIVFKTISILSMIFLFVMNTLSGSRIALFFLSLEFLLYFIFFSRLRTKIWTVIYILFLLFIIKISYPVEFQFFKLFLQNQYSSIQSENESYRNGSIKIRKALFHESIDLSLESGFLGVGAGNYISEMNGVRSKRTNGVKVAHNFLLELLSEYGLLLALVMVYILIRWGIDLIIIIKKSNGENRLIAYSCFSSLLLFIPASILPSSIIKYSFYWIIFAYIHLYIEQNLHLIIKET